MQTLIRTSLSLLLLCGALSAQRAVFFGQNVPQSTPAVNSIGPLDFDVDGAGWSTPGTTLTTGLMGSGTIGNANQGGWSKTGTGLTTEAHKSGCSNLSTFSVDGTVYAASRSSNSFGVDNSGTLRYMSAAAPSSGQVGFTKMVAMTCITVNTGTLGGSGLIDIVRMNGTISGAAIAQISTAVKCGGTLGIDLETIAGGTSNTACVTITTGNSYWVVLLWNSVTPTCTLSVYDTAGAQVGSTLTAASNCATGDIGSIDFGNRESGTTTGTNYFENTMVRFSGNPPTLNPLNTTQDPVYWVAQSHNNKTSAGTTVATTKALDVPSGYTMVVSCSNENASGQTTGVTSTAGDTFTAAAAVKSAANAQSISQWVGITAAARTAQLFTCTFPSSSFSNVDAQVLSPATYDIGAVGNTASGANITSGSFTPSTSTGTNIYCAYIQAGQAITPGTNYTQLNTSSTNSMGCGIRTNAPNSSQTATGTHSNTSASMIVVGNYK